ncbi:hypothetical protein C8J57DRAFT_1504981 [Mycena rebaudengoi]|nr:hypothetical protein C8J57DRAFT_1504981 [Mycena rebaudengoi]
MTSPSSPTDLDDVFQAMAQDSPVRPTAAAKRTHSAMLGEVSDGEDNTDAPPADTSTTPATVNQNVVAATMRYVERKRLRGEQKTDVEVFLNDPPSVREAKSYVQSLHIENMINKIIVATPPWTPSDDLLKNIYSYATAILLSTKLCAYKGNTPKNILHTILKKHRFDLPPGIEHDAAKWGKVKAAVQGAFTQLRSKFKKSIGASFKAQKKAKKSAPKSQQQNIFDLTQAMVEGTQCEVNILLCARVSFMRKSFLKNSSSKFWDTVDEDLAKIRKKANGDSKQIIRAFRHILKMDRETHGVDNYTIADVVDTFQQDVDNVVDATAATTVPGENEEEDDDEDEDEE